MKNANEQETTWNSPGRTSFLLNEYLGFICKAQNEMLDLLGTKKSNVEGKHNMNFQKRIFTLIPLLSKLFNKQSVRKSPPIGEVATAYHIAWILYKQKVPNTTQRKLPERKTKQLQVPQHIDETLHEVSIYHLITTETLLHRETTFILHLSVLIILGERANALV